MIGPARSGFQAREPHQSRFLYSSDSKDSGQTGRAIRKRWVKHEPESAYTRRARLKRWLGCSDATSAIALKKSLHDARSCGDYLSFDQIVTIRVAAQLTRDGWKASPHVSESERGVAGRVLLD